MCIYLAYCLLPIPGATHLEAWGARTVRATSAAVGPGTARRGAWGAHSVRANARHGYWGGRGGNKMLSTIDY